MLNSVLVKSYCAPKEFLDALKNPYLGLSHLVDEYALPLYYEEMKIDRLESEVNNT